jgi:outer membrane protein TolC
MKKSGIFLIILFLICVFPYTVSAEESLTWQGCVKEAAKNHPDLISAQENVKQEQAGKAIITSSAFPQIDSSLSASTTVSTTQAAGKKTSKTAKDYSYGASATQLLFDGFKTADNIKAAAENIKAAQYNFKFTSAEVRLRLRTAFIALLRAQEALNIAEDIRTLRRSDYELITLRYESGIEHKGALLTAQANLAEADFEISQTQRDLEVVQRQLIKEMGRERSTPVRAEGEFKVSDTAKERPDFEILAQNNPSLGKLIAQKNAAAFGIKAAQASFFPQLSAQAGAGKSGARWSPRDSQWSTGLTLSMPIFEGGLRFAQVAQSQALYNQARENERSNRAAIVLTLEQAWAAFQDAVETVEVQKQFLTAAQERANIAEAQYSLGLIQFDNWTIIQDSLVSQKKAYLNARANLLFAEANWIQAKGETLEYAD